MKKATEQIRESSKESWQKIESKARPSFVDRLGRNMALAGLLVLGVSALKNAQLPSGQTVLAAVQEITYPRLDDRLGAIDFVGSFFPETAAVFFEDAPVSFLTAPGVGAALHAWSREEPYLTYQTEANGSVYAAAPGQVMSVAHGMEEERVIRIRHENGVETMYYDLQEAYVQEGDQVTETTCLGVALPGKDATMEVRRAGKTVDPTAWMRERQGTP